MFSSHAWPNRDKDRARRPHRVSELATRNIDQGVTGLPVAGREGTLLVFENRTSRHRSSAWPGRQPAHAGDRMASLSGRVCPRMCAALTATAVVLLGVSHRAAAVSCTVSTPTQMHPFCVDLGCIVFTPLRTPSCHPFLHAHSRHSTPSPIPHRHTTHTQTTRVRTLVVTCVLTALVLFFALASTGDEPVVRPLV